jgi:hypothetical protein
MSEMTTEILEQNLGKIVLVRLKGGKVCAEDSKDSISTLISFWKKLKTLAPQKTSENSE